MTTAEPLLEEKNLVDDENLPYCRVYEDSWAAAIIFFPALFGFAINCWNIWRFWKTKKHRGSFAYLWTSRCIANAIILLIFMLYTCPVIFCNRQIPNQTIGYFIANSTGTFYLTLMFVQILLALHRFCASMNVKLYRFVSNPYCTAIQLSFSWFIGILSTAQWLVEDCTFWFDAEYWSWENECADWIIELSTPIPVKITFCSVALLNFLTFVRLWVLQKRKRNSVIDSRLKNNFRLLWQGTIHDSFFYLDIINQQYTSEIFDDKWWYLLTLSISWQWSHILDGLAILLLNEDLRSPIVKIFAKRTVSNNHRNSHNISRIVDISNVRVHHT